MSVLLPVRLRGAALLAVGAALVAGGLAGPPPGAATASSHREAPLISGMAPYDNVDVYAFVSPDKPDTTTLLANFWPFEEPAGGPNFFKFAHDARYEINVDNDGDSPAIPLLAIGAGAAFVTGGGLLWWRRRGMVG